MQSSRSRFGNSRGRTSGIFGRLKSLTAGLAVRRSPGWATTERLGQCSDVPRLRVGGAVRVAGQARHAWIAARTPLGSRPMACRRADCDGNDEHVLAEMVAGRSHPALVRFVDRRACWTRGLKTAVGGTNPHDVERHQ